MRSLRLGLAVLAGVGAVFAKKTEPRTLVGKEWLGIDGNWSTTEMFVGGVDASEGKLNLLISTALSETWVVGSGGCLDKEQLCPKYRGGTLDVWSSDTWVSLGDWFLDALKHLNVQANGNYGLDTLILMDSETDGLVSIGQAVVAAINTTEFYNGFFGVGITSSAFGGQASVSPFSKMVADYGWFASYTYGYTAGAYYRNSGTPSSLVLGGFDQKRFEPHNNDFTLEREANLPRALVRGIEVSVPQGAEKPGDWESNPRILSRMNTSFEVLIDSSTPYLWLPESICSEFVGAMNLTFNTTLDAFVMKNDQFNRLKEDDSFSFTFSLSSYDNTNNFGSPLDVLGVVNITLPAQAFAQTLEYPYKDETIRYGEPAVPYFPIKQSSGDNFILGRTFLQEAYVLTKYDSQTFSIHQAKFPSNKDDTDIQEVFQPPNSPYPPPLAVKDDGGLTKSQMIGIVAGTVVVCLIGLFAFCFCCRRRRKAKKARMLAFEDPKDTASSIVEETPRTPVARIFSKIIRRKRSRKAESVEAGTKSNPAEVGADATHEVYELSAPIGPVELDADNASINTDTELGTEVSVGSDQQRYEVAKRRMDRALAGPVPAYSPPETQGEGSGDASNGEKSMQDVSPVETYRPSDRGVSPTSSPTHTHPNSNSLPQSLPSPMSPHPDWTMRLPDLPSPMTAAPPFPHPIFTGSSSSAGSNSVPHTATSSKGPSFDPSSISRSNSSNAPSPTSTTSIVPPSPVFQRTPIDPARIICLGPLPENVQLPSPSNSTLPRLVGPDGRNLQLPGSPRTPTTPNPNAQSTNPQGSNPQARVSTDTLGSNYTDMEEQMVEEMTRQQSVSHANGPRSPSARSGHEQHEQHEQQSATGQRPLESPRSQERIDAGSELIHVPQLAERRYSWEEERSI